MLFWSIALTILSVGAHELLRLWVIPNIGEGALASALPNSAQIPWLVALVALRLAIALVLLPLCAASVTRTLVRLRLLQRAEGS